MKTIPMSGAYEPLTPILAADINTYDVVAFYQYFDMGHAFIDTKSGRAPFYNLNDMPKESYLDLSASCWDSRYNRTLSYKDVCYFATGDLSQAYSATMFVSYVNLDLWAQFADQIKALPHSGGYSDPYELVEKGYWTLDLWMELCKLCYKDDGDGTPDYEDRCGFMTYNKQLNNIMADMILAGSHATWSSIDSAGNVSIEIDSPKNAQIYQKLYELLCLSDAVTIPWIGGSDGEEGHYILDIFADGTVLLNVNTLFQAAEYLGDMKDDYAIMPLPLFDHGQFNEALPSGGYATQIGDSVALYGICSSVSLERLPAVTATLQRMAELSTELVVPALYSTVLGPNAERDLEMICFIRAGLYSDFVWIWSSDLGNLTWNFRSQYDEVDKIERNLLDWDRNDTGLYTGKLLYKLEKYFADQK